MLLRLHIINLQNRPGMLLPWLIFNPIAIAIYVIGTIVGLVHHNGISNTVFVVSHLTVGIAICSKYSFCFNIYIDKSMLNI